MKSCLIMRNAHCETPQEKRIVEGQWKEANNLRAAGLPAMETMLTMTNAAQTPAEAFREFDATTKIEARSQGEFSTLTKLLQVGRPVNIGKEVFEHRKASQAGQGQTSMSGQVGIKMDHVDYKFAGTVVPIHDIGFGRTWREVESMRAEGFDALVDDSRECELSLMEQNNSYLWNGDADIKVKGRSWLGIKADPSIATATIGLDLSAAASAAQDVQDEVRRIRDILRITNKCAQDLRVAVSQEIMSNWERSVALTDSTFGKILDFIEELRGIKEVYEDPELSGNEMFMFWDSQQGFHPVVGMGISTYAVQRQAHNDDFNFIKWNSVGWLAKTDFSDNKCALFAD
jgi:hypothetical protein